VTADELAELFIKQFAWTYEEHILAYGLNALTEWESWIRDDPERAWPVFSEIVARRRDDEMLYQVGHRLRLLLYRHWDAFHRRAEELVRATPRFARIVGEDFFNPETYRQTELDVEELIEAYARLDFASQIRFGDIIKKEPERGLRIAVEIIHRGPRHGLGSFDTFDPLRDLLEAHGAAVIDDVEEIARTSVLVRRALWRLMPGERVRPPREGETAAVWQRAIAAHAETTDFTDDDQPLPAPQTLSDDEEQLVEAWFVYEKNFWAFDAIWSLVSDEPETAWPIILRLLDRAEGQTIFKIAAGPLEDLLSGHGLAFIDRIAAEARSNPKLRTALTGVWLNEGDAVYERYNALMTELGLERE
jgi:hypothetical protein